MGVRRVRRLRAAGIVGNLHVHASKCSSTSIPIDGSSTDREALAAKCIVSGQIAHYRCTGN
jgi:hypothetical protein